MMLFETLLNIHIVAGATGFLVAPLALIVRKGGKSHRRWGKFFFWSMTVVAFTALIMAPMKGNLFLTLVAVFSFYLAFSGYRALYRKNAHKTGKTAFIDWFFAVANTVFSLSLLILGIIRLPDAFGIISIVFGLIGTMLGARDLRSFIRPANAGKSWFFNHMTGMIASYIAALSAFSAVNLHFDWLPTVIQWMWPTIIGVPLMMRWVLHYKRKFDSGKKVNEEVIVRILPGTE